MSTEAPSIEVLSHWERRTWKTWWITWFGWKTFLSFSRWLFELSGYTLRKLPSINFVYDYDGLQTIHNCDFLQDKSFKVAYRRGIVADSVDIHRRYWRVHVALWVAKQAALLDGDFCECGVRWGFVSSAIMKALDWNNLEKHFWLLDLYTTRLPSVQENFSEWKNTHVVVGKVPETLASITSERLSYLHLDMNFAPPEVDALRALWPKLVPGALVLSDDYAYRGFEPQKKALDQVAYSLGLTWLSLPTGQGLLIKPHGWKPPQVEGYERLNLVLRKDSWIK